MRDYGDKARIIVQGGCWVYFIREYCFEFSVVNAPPCHLFLLSHVGCPCIFDDESVTLQCWGPSMLPTFNNKGDVLMLEHFTTHLRYIRVGELSDVVPFE